MAQLSEEHLLIERRRPSGDPSDLTKLKRLDEEQAELWSDRFNQWRGRVAKVLSKKG